MTSSDQPTVEINDEWFDLSDPLERECHDRGHHIWGPDKFQDEAGVQGWHRCNHCFRIEPL